MASAPLIVDSAKDLVAVAGRAARAPTLALDVEGNGLFAYRAALCTVQLGWQEGDETVIAIVDTLATDPAPLREILGPLGPAKVLHDFTFDAKLLAEAGVLLANLRDTSVLARMLGRKATGLASLLASELEISVTKELQQHDWSRRPLGAREIEYLAGDVRYLIGLHDKLATEARALDIEVEVEVECAFKLEAALAPPRERRPAYLRIKGADDLDEVGLAVLRRLVDERERIAAQWDQPPFKVAGNDALLALAAARPTTGSELRRIRRGMSPRLLGVADRLVASVLEGIADGQVPESDRADPERMDRATAQL
ncbi:MAG TPA: HRDC domain-containing protein, partial [Polyangiaceae bacterium]|nr:HRDC domain-containing protein [Polyangiaceae bacterium]